ncbi:hypothetical protein ACFQ38_11425 [Sporosarcina contaminans]|uniref:Uncharacterized protein n=1 Tax=Sporosarcina contaminans TaxID=633403 RepID=A0ABW3TYC7_9BACL
MSTLFSALGGLFTLAFLVFLIIAIVQFAKKNKTKNKKTLMYLGVSFVLMVIFIILTPTNDEVVSNTPKKESSIREDFEKNAAKSSATSSTVGNQENKNVAKSDPKPTTVDKTGSLKTYMDETFDPLVRSVTSNIDTNWEYYMIEPLDRLAANGDLSSFKADVELMISLSNSVVKQIDESETPSELDAGDKNDIDEVKSGLKNAINKRVEAAESILLKKTTEEVLNAEVDSLINESNEHLTKAVTAYKRLLDK